MEVMLYFWLGVLVLGMVGVASNPAPYFAAFGLVVASGAGCAVLSVCGCSFLALTLFLIYLGGMLVVFGYSAALAADVYPESWGDASVLENMLLYLGGLGVAGVAAGWGWYGLSLGVMSTMKELVLVRGDAGGVSCLYELGGGMMVLCAGALLLTLFVVLELVRGLSRGALRAV
uniref:NADH-ubiquinone oxidoreductase chain 6 n=1 Tax=Jenkinsia sp. CL54 TaxID=466963 RepID=E6N1A3_9TELE|nr:NADH dehydrogenase subunit 6 [Jenkinsia sp. CL54]BAJ54179.1 NADH dehydrogenase subunit 6 [Jenkinsia sp. CL54]